MRKKIGIYDYSLIEGNQVLVTYSDASANLTDTVIMIFMLRDSQVFSQANINDPDYLEISNNAIKIFKGEITFD